ncbi:MAG: hypothetical protein OXN83_03215 [Oligoflexia bacterium]|nr:hypothetical protein [Oligoflexia bacterium]
MRAGYGIRLEICDQRGEFDNKNQGYKRIRFRAKRAQGYLGEAYLSEQEQKEKEDKPVFKATQSSENRGAFGDETKKGEWVSDRKPAKKNIEDEKIKNINFSAFLKYLVLAVLIIALVVVIFSQVMEYQSRD